MQFLSLVTMLLVLVVAMALSKVTTVKTTTIKATAGCQCSTRDGKPAPFDKSSPASDFNECKITSPAHPNKACACKAKHTLGKDDKTLYTCYGEETECPDKTNHLCKHPDTTVDSCKITPKSFCEGYKPH